MKSTNSQTPGSFLASPRRPKHYGILAKETSNPHHLNCSLPSPQPTVRPWSLNLGASLVLGCWCLVLPLCPVAQAQSYAIDWFTIDGGGGASTGGVFTVSGTIGQPDAGSMTGGNFGLVGGFWSVIAAVPSPGAPLLAIHRTTTNTVIVSWPSPSTGYQLQVNTNNVSSLNWSNVTTTIADDGTTKTLLVNPPAGKRFYRLFHP